MDVNSPEAEEPPRVWRRRFPGGTFGPPIANSSPFAPTGHLSMRMDRVHESFCHRRLEALAESSSELQPDGEHTPTAEHAVIAPAPWCPRVDVSQSATSILISVELPGVRKEEVQIEAAEDGIAIYGRCRTENDAAINETDRRYFVAERSRGCFHRIISLPRSADLGAARAGLHEGVLEITIPLVQSPQHRLIEIEC
jgi:HSP20 family molecular chaperone IbpA